MDLCTACGLCCSGALFPFVELTPEESRRLAARRLPLHDDGRRLHQPCAAYDGRCAVYEDRPRNCAAYECTVLASVDAGTTTPADALALVARSRALAISVRARVPGDADLWLDVATHAEDSEAWRREHAELLLDLGTLRRLLGRFRDFGDAGLRG